MNWSFLMHDTSYSENLLIINGLISSKDQIKFFQIIIIFSHV